MADVAKQHDLLRFVKLEHKITQAEWLQGQGKWKITIRGPNGVVKDRADFFINGGGCLKSAYPIHMFREFC